VGERARCKDDGTKISGSEGRELEREPLGVLLTSAEVGETGSPDFESYGYVFVISVDISKGTHLGKTVTVVIIYRLKKENN
jgi:hypothetical protein